MSTGVFDNIKIPVSEQLRHVMLSEYHCTISKINRVKDKCNICREYVHLNMHNCTYSCPLHTIHNDLSSDLISWADVFYKLTGYDKILVRTFSRITMVWLVSKQLAVVVKAGTHSEIRLMKLISEIFVT